ncbi:Rgp1-domain-containing protein [Rhizopus microsporus ATCC 52813]|uniref:Rgp1-domain-containing protein n=2 Tax=Rhizopus microsporus TaxID=58291 RepID=A0A2G4SHR1_RHIZD|nr:Rgp1-domain-containing protein [Rhizopus microsporus ATCC 52813]PHZ08310.1 Rgp1-domain-containing protein [Rhizopus microsporus ATCC 52813]
MSVLVTTTFSQGAVFYAGETLRCKISFTNPLKPPTTATTTRSTPMTRSPSTLQLQPANTPSSSTRLMTSLTSFLSRAASVTTDDPIAIELDSPRTSIDTYPISPRSSMESTASYPSLRRLSTLSQTIKTEHLLCGFVQVVGSFIVDPSLININEFDPLKQYSSPQGGFGGGLVKSDTFMNARTLPVFSTAPSILFVDLDLEPGETKQYTYKVKLPNDIPPSHRGKAIRFNYYLVVGAQRASQSKFNQGQVAQIRFRVLNHVAQDGSRPIYDLMNPVIVVKDEAIVNEHQSKVKRSEEKSRIEERKEFIDYINELLDNRKSRHEITRRESEAYDEKNREIEEASMSRSCSQIVSRLTHGSRKAMYDICKNNQRVAKLHLIKTAHRLGEPIVGVLDFTGATLSTYKISIFLESCEVVEETIALRPQQQIARVSRKIHSDFYSFSLGNRRLSFSLPIPATCSPDFQTTGVSLKYYLKFEFITGSDAPFIPINVDERHRHYQCLQDVEVSTFDCQIPVIIYGSPGGQDRALFGRPHTFRVH